MSNTPIGEKPHPLRRQYMVNKRYQGSFIALICGMAIVVAVLASSITYLRVKDALAEVMYRSHLPTGDTWEIIAPAVIQTNVALAAIALVVAIAAVALALGHGSRLIRAIEAELNAIDASEIAEVQKSTGALWRGVSESAARRLRERMRPYVEAADSLDRMAGRLEGRVQPDASLATQQLIAELDAILGTMDEKTGGIQC